MINKINQIKKFGCFDHFEWNDLKPFSPTNILYGYNGSGKTTLSNLFYLFSAECKNKNELAKEYLINDSEFQIQIENDIFSEKNFDAYNNSPIYVFNTRFISDHIFDGSKSNMSSFSSESAGITNEKIDKIDEKIKILVSRNNQLINWKNRLTQKLENIWNIQKRDFNSKITGKRLTDSPVITDISSNNINEEKDKLEKLYNDSDKINKIEILVETLSLIKGKAHNLSICEIEKDNLKQLLDIPVNVNSIEKIKSHIKEVFDNFSDKNTDVNKWFIDGNSLLKNNKENDILTCPLCQSNIEKVIEELISGYDSHFNENIKELFRQLEDYENTLRNIPAQFQEQRMLLNDLGVLLAQFDSSVQNKIPENKENLKSNIKKIKKIINDKRISPNASINIPDALFIDIVDFNSAIIKIKKEINDCIEVLGKEIDVLTKKDVIGEIKKKAKEISIAEYNDKSNSIFPNSNKTNGEIAKKINALIKETEKIKNNLYIERDDEVSKLDAETKFVNIYLAYLGISKFVIQKEKNKDTDNIVITYKAGTKKRSLNCSLSEGEKTALAFAYFLSKIRVEKIEKTCSIDNAIIVIDDPISSLDENRLYHTANLIDSFFHYNDLANGKMPKQTFVFSHNIIFLKYITNIFHANSSIKDNINEYYIEPFKHIICKVPNSLKNFTTTYLEKIDEIIKYQENTSDITYEEAKKFIPNYIRTVLESFLSFKFALVREGSKGRLPGLNFLIGKALAELNNYDENLEVGNIKKEGVKKRLFNLKRIADNESHGSISKIESLNYISEKELKDYCKHTLQVIKYFDEIHFTKAKSLI
jgi:wobble nucleotide-excising tRNase